jgi:hypothetical protein
MRQHKRIVFRSLFRIKVRNPHNNRLIGYIGDISEGGMRLVSDVPLEVGERYELSLNMRDREGVQRQVEVGALCLWAGENTRTGHHEAGLALAHPSEAYYRFVASLRGGQTAALVEE